jgi:hypothetical protein
MTLGMWPSLHSVDLSASIQHQVSARLCSRDFRVKINKPGQHPAWYGSSHTTGKLFVNVSFKKQGWRRSLSKQIRGVVTRYICILKTEMCCSATQKGFTLFKSAYCFITRISHSLCYPQLQVELQK